MMPYFPFHMLVNPCYVVIFIASLGWGVEGIEKEKELP